MLVSAFQFDGNMVRHSRTAIKLWLCVRMPFGAGLDNVSRLAREVPTKSCDNASNAENPVGVLTLVWRYF